MEPNFEAFQLIGQIALGIIGFSAILIGLSRTSEGFSAPDNFRVQLLTYSAFGAMFGSVIPFAIFSGNNFDVAWLICFWIMSVYAVMGLIPIKLYLFQTGILALVFVLSLMMIVSHFFEPIQIYVVCLMLYLVQSSVAFIRTMFFRVS